jgi:3-dehydroquinate synthase
VPTSTTTVAVQTPSASYDVHIGTHLLASLGTRIDALLAGALSSGKQRVFIITSPEILKLHGDQLLAGFSTKPEILTVPAGESHKRLSTVERLLEQLANSHADRDSVLIAFGGGVLGDMTGFLAAIYMRGIRYIQVPTTALAQIDSSIGGKTGVNLAAGKNLAGSFHHPLAVFADPAVLSTLPPAELRAGLQESIKAGIIRDPNLFALLEREQTRILSADLEALTEVVTASVRVKAAVVNADERESGLRMILNFGHTLGHAIEAATEYKQLLHGEAIAWGMLAAIRIAADRALITAADAERMSALIRAYGPPKPFTAEAAHLVALTAKDKKNRSGARSFVLPTSIGSCIIVCDVTEPELLRAAEAITTEARALRPAGVSS